MREPFSKALTRSRHSPNDPKQWRFTMPNHLRSRLLAAKPVSLCLALLCSGAMGCAPADDKPSPGSGGSQGSGGAVGSGGAPSGSGGAGSSGGTVGSGGAVSSGGTVGSGGATGSGGTPAGSGGTTTGSGGSV